MMTRPNHLYSESHCEGDILMQNLEAQQRTQYHTQTNKQLKPALIISVFSLTSSLPYGLWPRFVHTFVIIAKWNFKIEKKKNKK